MDALGIIVAVLLAISTLIIIVTVLLQQGSKQGLGVITGGAETFFGKNKAKSYEGKLAMATKVAATIFIFASLYIAYITK